MARFTKSFLVTLSSAPQDRAESWGRYWTWLGSAYLPEEGVTQGGLVFSTAFWFIPDLQQDTIKITGAPCDVSQHDSICLLCGEGMLMAATTLLSSMHQDLHSPAGWITQGMCKLMPLSFIHRHSLSSKEALQLSYHCVVNKGWNWAEASCVETHDTKKPGGVDRNCQ